MRDAGIAINAEGPAEGSFVGIAEAVVKILAAASEHGMDQSTTVAALDVIVRVSKIEHITISGCYVTTTPAPDSAGFSIDAEDVGE